eukprot:13554963-Ditylum_brightwellii.AAC.1
MEHDQKDQEVEDPSDEEGEEKEETCGKRKEGSPSVRNISCFGWNDDAILWTLSRDILDEKQANWGGIHVFYTCNNKWISDNFTPNGCTAAKSKQHEYETCSSMGKTESTILH